MVKCPNCGEEFEPRTVIQKYCCRECGVAYRKTHISQYPSIRFVCAQCGEVVVTDPERKDKRTKFCSPECEKKFWKHTYKKFKK